MFMGVSIATICGVIIFLLGVWGDPVFTRLHSTLVQLSPKTFGKILTTICGLILLLFTI